MKLSVIIPAKNEEKNIKNTVSSIHEYLSGHSIDHEIIVVANNCTDQTVNKTNELKESISELKLLEISAPGNTKGLAVKEGMKLGQGDIKLFTDADNSTSIDHIQKMLPYINEGYGVVIGSIAVKGHKVASGSEPLWRRLFGKLGNIYIQILAVPGIYDTQRGFKMFTKEASDKIFPKLMITGWGFDVEVLALARKFGYKIKEVPVDWKNDPNSHVGLNAYKQVLIETLRVRLNLIAGKYN